MRKGLTSCLSVFLCTGALIAPTGFAADKFEIAASETFDALGYLTGDVVGGFISTPTVRCPGYEPTGDPMQPCPVGSRTHLRGTVLVSRLESADPAMAGWMTVELNGNLDARFAGPVWGTFRTELDAGGAWEGTYQGLRIAEEGYWTAALNVIGKGYGGDVDGMKLMAVDQIWTPFAIPIGYFGTIEGRILDPK